MGRARPDHETTLSRAKREAAIVALKVLVLHHPRVALDMAAAAAVRAGRVGLQSMTERLRPAPEAASRGRRLTRREVRRILRAIRGAERQRALPAD